MVKIEPKRYRYSLVFSTVFFPFTYPEIYDSLEKRKFDVSPISSPPPLKGPRIYAGGPIAKKEGCQIYLDESAKIFGLEGRSLNVVRKTFEELKDISKNDFNLQLDKDIDYSEIIAELIAISDKNPLETTSRLFNDVLFFKKINEITDLETSQFSVRITPKGIEPSSKNWFDINIEPSLTRPKDSYRLGIVYRDKDITKVDNFVKNMHSLMERIINQMEES